MMMIQRTRKMTSLTTGGEEDEPSKIIKKKEEQETSTDNKEAVEKPDLKRRRDMWEQSHDEDSPSWDLPDATPTPGRIDDATPLVKGKIPRVADSDVNPAAGVTPDPVPAGMSWDATPKLATMGTTTPPAAAYVEPIPDAINTLANLWQKVDEERNRPLTDGEFDAMFLLLNKRDVPEEIPDGLPFMEPKDYEYFGPLLNKEDKKDDVPEEIPDGFPFMEPKDYEYFGPSLNKEDGEPLPPDEQEERKIMKVLLELKNGTLHQMKTALRRLIDYAREFGCGPLLNRILPLLMHPTLNNQERRLMVKVFSRALYELDELVSPHAHRILVVIESLLMDEDCDVRAEGTEIIYNLSKAAGLNTMIDAFRPDIGSPDEYVRNATARSFSVVASALGIAALLPFVKEVCQNGKSWPARHTGFMIVHQIINFIGAAVLPHSRSLVEIIKLGLDDENKKVRTVATLALDALNKFAARYGIKI